MIRAGLCILSLVVATTGCGKKDEAKPAEVERPKPAATNARATAGRQAASDRPAPPKPLPPPKLPAGGAPGTVKVTIGGLEKRFGYVDPASNYVLPASFGLLASTGVKGEELRIVGAGLTIPSAGPFPATLEAVPAAGAPRPGAARRMINVMYTDRAGTRFVSVGGVTLTVTSYANKRLVATLSSATLTSKQGQQVSLDAASFDVTTR